MSEQIGREIAKQALTPVHILQATLRIISGGDAKQCAVATVPLSWQFLDRQPLFQQGQLK